VDECKPLVSGRKAADKGDSSAQFFVGGMYASGLGVDKDLPLGKWYLGLCAAQGNQDAVTLLNDYR
jgi:TPR repeat protein